MIRPTIPSRIAIAAIAACAITAQAQADIREVCLELPAGAGIVKAEIASGCLPTSPGYEGKFAIAVDPDRATIAIDGSFAPVREQRIATADCMGSRIITQEAQAAGPRRYTVQINGQHAGAIDASDTLFGKRTVKGCFDGSSKVNAARPEGVTLYARSMFSQWIAQPKGKPVDPIDRASYATLGQLAAALLEGHPEAMVGRPSARIMLSPGQWRGKAWQGRRAVRFMAVRIEEHGYLDDSVSGKRTFAAAILDPQTGEWRIGSRWHQFMCARGERAGQWSAQPCP